MPTNFLVVKKVVKSDNTAVGCLVTLLLVYDTN